MSSSSCVCRRGEEKEGGEGRRGKRGGRGRRRRGGGGGGGGGEKTEIVKLMKGLRGEEEKEEKITSSSSLAGMEVTYPDLSADVYTSVSKWPVESSPTFSPRTTCCLTSVALLLCWISSIWASISGKRRDRCHETQRYTTPPTASADYRNTASGLRSRCSRPQNRHCSGSSQSILLTAHLRAW